VINAYDSVLYDGEWLRLFDACAFKGANVEFDISDEPTKESPIAINVVLERVADPRLSEKILKRKTDKENRERHEQNRRKEENRKLAKQIELKKYVKKA
jgi:hypothetical protein